MQFALKHSPGPWVFIGDKALGHTLHQLVGDAKVQWQSLRPEDISDWNTQSPWGTTVILDSRDSDALWLSKALAILCQLPGVAVVGVGEFNSGFAECLPGENVNAWSFVQLMRLAAQARREQLGGGNGEADPLTGVYRRTALQGRLAQALSESYSSDSPMAYLLVDVSGLKELNARVGEQAGDRALQAVGHALRSMVRPRDSVGRVDGTTFGVLCRNIRGGMQVFSVVEKVQAAILSAFAQSKTTGYLSYSIGVAVYPDGGLSATEVARSAELAMVRSRRQVGNSCRFFTSVMGTQRRRQRSLEQGLRRALSMDYFQLSLAPQWRGSDQQGQASEAHIIWADPERGIVDRSDWWDLAQETGQLEYIQLWALERMCQLFLLSEDANPTFALDLACEQLLSDSFETELMHILNRWGVGAEQITFELQGGSLWSAAEACTPRIQRLFEKGFRFVLDEFGGHAFSPLYLERWPIEGVKLSPEWVARSGQQGEQMRLLSAMVQFCQGLGVQVQAAGVNTQTHFDALLALGVNQMQGRAISVVLTESQWLDRLEGLSQISHADTIGVFSDL